MRRKVLGILALLSLLLAAPAFAQPGFLSAKNSSSTPLGGNAVFTGTSEEVLPFKSVGIFVFTDQASATSGLSLQFSTDATNWDLSYTATVSASTSKSLSIPVQARYFRLVYTNGAVAQGSFRLQTIFFSSEVLPLDGFGALFARSDHPNRFSCVVAVSTATTIQAVGGSCVAPGAGLSLYVTDIEFSTSAAGIAADAFPTLKYGTGGTCGSNTTVFWQALTAAAGVFVSNSTIPVKIPANNEICWITSTAGSKTLQLRGFIAP